MCRCEIAGSSDEVEYSPFPVPRNGLLARLWEDNGVGVDRVERQTDDDHDGEVIA